MRFLYLVVYLVLVSSCNSYFYAPTTPNVPLIDQKGNFVGSVGVSESSVGSDLIHVGTVQAAYSPMDHLAFQGSIFTRNRIGIFNHEERSDYLINGGVGYYTMFNNGIFFETYAGAGKGLTAVNDSYLDVHFINLFIQPTIAHKSKVFDIGFTNKILYADFTVVHQDGIDPEYETDNHIRQLNNANFLFYEPTFFFRIGYKYVKLQFHLTRSFKLNKEDIKAFDNNIGLSLIVDVGGKINSQE